MAEHTGGMIALLPRAEDAERLAVRGGERPEDLHLTLCYLGDDVTEWSPGRRNYVASKVALQASMYGNIEAATFGAASFNPGDEDACAVFLVGDSREIVVIHDFLEQEVADLEQRAPFCAHITIGYGMKADKLGEIGPVVFDRLRLAMADQVFDFPLGEEKALLMEFYEFKQKTRQAKGAGSTLDFLSAFEIKSIVEHKLMSPDPNAAKLREYWAHGKGLKKWFRGLGVHGNFDRLRRKLAKYVENPHMLDGLTANIYKLATGQWPGKHAEKSATPAISAEEFKAAMLLADPEADIDLDDDAFSLFAEEPAEEESDDDADTDDDAAYEQLLIDEVDWQMDGSGGLVRDEDDPEDPADNFVDEAPVVRRAGPTMQATIFD